MQGYVLLAIVVLLFLLMLTKKEECPCAIDPPMIYKPKCEQSHDPEDLNDVATPVKEQPRPPVYRSADGYKMEDCVKFEQQNEQNRKFVEFVNGNYIMHDTNYLGVF